MTKTALARAREGDAPARMLALTPFALADLPGLTKDDVKADVTDDAVTIEGEREHRYARVPLAE